MHNELDTELNVLTRSAFFKQLKTHYRATKHTQQQSLFIAMEYECISQLRSVLNVDNVTYLLKRSVQIFQDNLPDNAVVGRSLKEINAFLPDFDESQLDQLIECLQSAFNVPIVLPNGQILEVKPKLISAMFPGVFDRTDNADRIINQMAMFLGYCDQTNSTSQHFHLDKSTLNYLNHRVAIDRLILGAQANDEFKVVYQPKVNISNGVIIGAEALIRWESPELGWVSPLQFIERAEFTGMIQPMSLFVLHQSIQALDHCREIDDKFIVSINLSASCIESNYFVDELEYYILNSGHPAACFEFEVTESVAIKNYQVAHHALQRLRDLGCRIALDDFGTGHSSLAWLSKMPLDTLKIDRRFIVNMLHSVADIQVVKTIVALGHACGLDVIAEGIEEKQQADLAYLELNCLYAQGYLFGKPMALSDLLVKLSDAPVQSRSNQKVKISSTLCDVLHCLRLS
ncbi:EAL domain-containing protein [Catenovulum sediminis]|uniref:EAL domain-containing protein n=2 Tax=Catenovulum sediminis TaxID=1740262 RepID=A0ABV1RMK1_9ALTE|nr:EAL domain-containing protein [Catenovulum sediminis]